MAEGDWWFDLKTHTVVPDNNETRNTTTTHAGTTISDCSIARREHPTQHGMLTLYVACMPCTASRAHAAWDNDRARPAAS